MCDSGPITQLSLQGPHRRGSDVAPCPHPLCPTSLTSGLIVLPWGGGATTPPHPAPRRHSPAALFSGVDFRWSGWGSPTQAWPSHKGKGVRLVPRRGKAGERRAGRGTFQAELLRADATGPGSGKSCCGEAASGRGTVLGEQLPLCNQRAQHRPGTRGPLSQAAWVCLWWHRPDGTDCRLLTRQQVLGHTSSWMCVSCICTCAFRELGCCKSQTLSKHPHVTVRSSGRHEWPQPALTLWLKTSWL